VIGTLSGSESRILEKKAEALELGLNNRSLEFALIEHRERTLVRDSKHTLRLLLDECPQLVPRAMLYSAIPMSVHIFPLCYRVAEGTDILLAHG
jgi:hypothetical protein